jgi:NadR type nicotinamide-nucleotide adenylyltransferase
MLKKIVILGPESTGKSTLCKQLAEHYKTLWCPEYAREYLLQHGMNYSFDDLLTIAKEQIKLEDRYAEEVGKTVGQEDGRIAADDKTNFSGLTDALTSRLLFIDTDMYVMKVWCEFVFDNCHRFILDQIVERKYDLYLLCNVDLPWVKDELREYPDLDSRQRLYYIYKDIMINQPVPWVDINGGYEERLQKAISAVNGIIS